MSGTAQLPWALKKEIRALLVPWLACLAGIAAAAVLGRLWRGLAMPTYAIGAVAIGAWSIGHEYTDRTITLLLSHPVRRSRLLLEKLRVLAAILLTLFAAASLFMWHATGLRTASAHPSEWAALLLPALCGLCLAPWLTMLCRSAIAGTVFSLAIPGLLLVVGELVAATTFGSPSGAKHFRMVVLWGGTLSVCAAGGVMGWRTFMRLEAIDGRGQDVQLPRWLRPSRTLTAIPSLSKRHPVCLLVKKELRVQQMALVVAGLYVLGWLGVSSTRHLAPDLADVFNALTLFYAGLIALLVGSLAVAEERQMGTLEWQVLLPMPASRQLAVKVGVALGLAVALGLGLPMLLTGGRQLLPPALRLEPLGRLVLAVPIIMLTVAGLYVSSVCSSGLRALMISLPAVFGAILFERTVVESLGPAVFAVISHLPRPVSAGGLGPHAQRLTLAVAPLLLAVGFLAVVLRFALANYRSTDRPAGRLVMQVIGIAASLVLGLMALMSAMIVLAPHMP